MMNFLKKNLFKFRVLKNNLKSFYQIKDIIDKNNFNYNIFYNKEKKNFLSDLFIKYKSDKAINKDNILAKNLHNYSDYYDELFFHCRHTFKKIFECGIGSQNSSNRDFMKKEFSPGASLRAWRDYFFNAEIYGADIDKNLLFNENRIKTFYVNQMEKNSVLEMWKNINQNNFDLIIDDGMHEFSAGICLFENSIKNLSNNGVYIIEDLKTDHVNLYQKYFSSKNYNIKFINFGLPHIRIVNNTILTIRKI